MLESFTTGERYGFIIAVIIVLGVYFGGFTTIINATGPQQGNLLTIGQGRIAYGPNAGQFPSYPANGPALTH